MPLTPYTSTPCGGVVVDLLGNSDAVAKLKHFNFFKFRNDKGLCLCELLLLFDELNCGPWRWVCITRMPCPTCVISTPLERFMSESMRRAGARLCDNL